MVKNFPQTDKSPMNLKQDKFKTLRSRHTMVKLQKIKSKVGNLESRLGCRRRKQKEG